MKIHHIIFSPTSGIRQWSEILCFGYGMFWLWNVLATEKIVLLPNGVKDADILFNGEKRRAGLC